MWKVVWMVDLLLTIAFGLVLYWKLIQLTQEIRIMKMGKGLQEKLDALADQLETNDINVVAAILNEKAEVADAINNPKFDTSRIEAAIAKSELLEQQVKDIFQVSVDVVATDAAQSAPVVEGSTDEPPAGEKEFQDITEHPTDVPIDTPTSNEGDEGEEGDVFNRPPLM